MMNKIKKIFITSIPVFVSVYSIALAMGDNVIEFKSPLQNVNSISELIAIFVSWIIQLGTIAVVLAFIYVGYQFVAARGNPTEIKKAKDAFLWTVIGTLVLIGSSVLVEVIKNTLTQGGVITTP